MDVLDYIIKQFYGLCFQWVNRQNKKSQTSFLITTSAIIL